VGDNSLLVAANKVDLLPKDFKPIRVKQWVRDELIHAGVETARAADVMLMSSKTGTGVDKLLNEMRKRAYRNRGDIYIVGAANVGKSTLINRLLGASEGKSGGRGGGSGGSKGKSRSRVTTSVVPGTTLSFIKLRLQDGTTMFDTPGLIMPQSLSSRLDSQELKAVLPKGRVDHSTLRVAAGSSVMLGGLARIDMTGGRPMWLTFYKSDDVTLHVTNTTKAEADGYVEKHVGEMLAPPYTPERLEALGPHTESIIEIDGSGWKVASADVVLSGLGWFAVTGAGTCEFRVRVPEGVEVFTRPPLMPFEAQGTLASFSGARVVKVKQAKPKKRGRGVPTKKGRGGGGKR